MASNSRPVPSQIAHLGLRTKNREKLIKFYQTLLGATVVLENDFISVLTWDQEHHRLAIIHDATAVPKQPNSSGMDHMALKFDSLADLLQVYRLAKEDGVEPKFCLNHGATTSLYYLDPDNNEVEIQIEGFDNVEDMQKHMKSLDPEKVRAVRFDAEDLLRRFEAGEDDETLRKAGFIGPQPSHAGTSTAAIVAQ
ncbi:biphenyl-2 [Colletotrichum tabaci]|uniref:Biphenyl-2 n=1 Tax=Colletotrichum tabaci TaxID=1209068 RepID=A0AAV9T4C9_9PEZI